MKKTMILAAALSALSLGVVATSASAEEHQRGRDPTAHHDPVDRDAPVASGQAVDRQRGRDQTAHHDPVDNDAAVTASARATEAVHNQRGRDQNGGHNDPVDHDGPR
jgi:hypothetical protein